MKVLIIGAGAIGRGYLPWIFKGTSTQITFVDANQKLIEQMKTRKRFSSFMVKNNRYEELEVDVSDSYTPDDFLEKKIDKNKFDTVYISVGPRNVAFAASLLKNVSAPIVSCENDPNSVEILSSILGRTDIYFAVPDVITSNTASLEMLEKDPLAICTEDGQLFIDDRYECEGNFKKISINELLNYQWCAKLYLHNTPHCIAAYLGALVGSKYLHQSMAYEEVNEIVTGSMEEMLNALKASWNIPHDFLNWYAEKELARFRSELLFDPISRVAREPLRKLELDGRLVGASQMCLSLGFVPQNILLGITAALLFDDPNDKDKHLAFMQRSLNPSTFLTHVLGLREGEALEVALKARLPIMLNKLKKLSNQLKVGAK